MEVQCGRGLVLDKKSDENAEENEESESIDDIYDTSMRPKNSFYPLVLKICAATRVKQDMSRAMTIAFEIYDKIIEHGMKPSPKTFELMYTCVVNFLDQHPEEEKDKLLQRVFDPASKYGLTRKELLSRHKQSLHHGRSEP